MEELQLKSKISLKQYFCFWLPKTIRSSLILPIIVTLIFSLILTIELYIGHTEMFPSTSFLLRCFSQFFELTTIFFIPYALIIFLFNSLGIIRHFKNTDLLKYEWTYKFAEEKFTAESERGTLYYYYPDVKFVFLLEKLFLIALKNKETIFFPVTPETKDTAEKVELFVRKQRNKERCGKSKDNAQNWNLEELTIKKKVSVLDYFKFVYIYTGIKRILKVALFAGLVAFVLSVALLQFDDIFIDLSIFLAVTFLATFVFIAYIFFGSIKFYKQVSTLTLENTITFTDEFIKEENEEKTNTFEYTEITELKKTRRMLLAYLGYFNALIFPINKENRAKIEKIHAFLKVRCGFEK